MSGPRFLDEEILSEGRRHICRVLNGKYDKETSPQRDSFVRADGLRKITNAWWADSFLERIATDTRIGYAAAKLLNVKEVYLWKDHLIIKEGKSGERGNVGWHQDKPYWDESSSDKMLTVSIALDNFTEENGCLMFVPGSHKLGFIQGADFYDSTFDKQVRGAVACPIPAGYATFHHSMTLHGSGPNNMQQSRVALAIHVVDGDAKLTKQKDDEAYDISVGDLFRGPRFPRIWSPRTI